jgi:hypothetical protein
MTIIPNNKNHTSSDFDDIASFLQQGGQGREQTTREHTVREQPITEQSASPAPQDVFSYLFQNAVNMAARRDQAHAEKDSG